jgi:RimJ/RimL family protein N-acetyltransferase
MTAAASRELTTGRLRLRQWRPADEVALAAINSDPEVTRYLAPPLGPGATRAFYETVVGHWATHGFGLWAAESLEPEHPGAFLGFIGLAHPSFIPVLAERVEIGWRLARRAWGRGLASEGAAAVRDEAFTVLKLPEVISIIHPDNGRSRRVAEKLGMAVCERVVHPVIGDELDVWQLRAPASAARGAAATLPEPASAP